jgi:hypothetical protein
VTSFGENKERFPWGKTFQKVKDLLSGRLVDISPPLACDWHWGLTMLAKNSHQDS